MELAGRLQRPKDMVRKFVFVPGADPGASRRSVSRTTEVSKVTQWLLVALALTISAIGFSLAKPSQAPGAALAVSQSH